MPEPTKIPRPFADSGDKNSIPDSSGSIGFASWQEGFPAITGTPFAQGGVAPKRADFNGIFNALSAATVWNQQGGVYAYDATTDYEVGNVVLYNGDLYICITANGPSSSVKAPTDSTVWVRIVVESILSGTGTIDDTKVDTGKGNACRYYRNGKTVIYTGNASLLAESSTYGGTRVATGLPENIDTNSGINYGCVVQDNHFIDAHPAVNSSGSLFITTRAIKLNTANFYFWGVYYAN